MTAGTTTAEAGDWDGDGGAGKETENTRDSVAMVVSDVVFFIICVLFSFPV